MNKPLLLFALFGFHGIAATVPADSCSRADVQAAITSASDGDTVTVPSGDCTWTTQVSIPDTKGITLVGAGQAATIIRDGGILSSTLLASVKAGNSVTRITGFTFDGNGVNKTSGQAEVYINFSDAALDAFRVDHNTIENLGERGLVVNMQCYQAGGLVDHNTISNGGTATQAMAIWGCGANDSTPFSRGFELGTNKAIFVENNTFSWTTTQSDGALDAYGGSRFVFRFNTISGTFYGHHGADSGYYRGQHTVETYHNSHVSHGESYQVSWVHRWRSATGVDFSNSASGTGTGGYKYLLSLTNYRSRGAGLNAFEPWGACDGTSPWDGNEVGKEGYPCLDQIGHVFTDTSGGSNTLYGLYVWGNTVGGVQLNAGVDITEVNPLHIVENRDFYNENDAFGGTSGIGIGPIGGRPATCTAGVAYWATDEGEWNSLQAGADGRLYKCTATDTWTLYYTPYTYPHPLQGYFTGTSRSTGRAVATGAVTVR